MDKNFKDLTILRKSRILLIERCCENLEVFIRDDKIEFCFTRRINDFIKESKAITLDLKKDNYLSFTID